MYCFSNMTIIFEFLKIFISFYIKILHKRNYLVNNKIIRSPLLSVYSVAMYSFTGYTYLDTKIIRVDLLGFRRFTDFY